MEYSKETIKEFEKVCKNALKNAKLKKSNQIVEKKKLNLAYLYIANLEEQLKYRIDRELKLINHLNKTNKTINMQ